MQYTQGVQKTAETVSYRVRCLDMIWEKKEGQDSSQRIAAQKISSKRESHVPWERRRQRDVDQWRRGSTRPEHGYTGTLPAEASTDVTSDDDNDERTSRRCRERQELVGDHSNVGTLPTATSTGWTSDDDDGNTSQQRQNTPETCQPAATTSSVAVNSPSSSSLQNTTVFAVEHRVCKLISFLSSKYETQWRNASLSINIQLASEVVILTREVLTKLPCVHVACEWSISYASKRVHS